MKIIFKAKIRGDGTSSVVTVPAQFIKNEILKVGGIYRFYVEVGKWKP